MAKPIVFISHITEETGPATELKRILESEFLDMISVFVSSDRESIAKGEKWLDTISHALSTCTVLIVLCSPKALNRPWINFEAGAGWVRDIPVIPLCHSGVEPSKLPLPLSMRQGAGANDNEDLQGLTRTIASALGCKAPRPDFRPFLEAIRALGRRPESCTVEAEWHHERPETRVERITILRGWYRIEDGAAYAPGRQGHFNFYAAGPSESRYNSGGYPATLVYIATPPSDINIQVLLADVRVLLEWLPQAETPTVFVVARHSSWINDQELITEAFGRLLEVLPVGQRSFFRLELWDDAALKTEELRLGLRFD